jgi:hypothetical protein
MNMIPKELFQTRRSLLKKCGMGFGGLIANSMLMNHSASSPFASKPALKTVKAKRVIHFFMNGGPSQVDTFDPKPLLDQYDGKMLPNLLKTERPTGAAMKSPFKFKKYGQCGLEVSELFAKTAQHADDLCLIRSMTTDVPNHEPSFLMMNTGDARLSRPSLGSWLTYGLGTENQNLPAYISMSPDGFPTIGKKNWQAAFLPSYYQGTFISTGETEINKLIKNIKNSQLNQKQQRAQIDLLYQLNQEHLQQKEMDTQLEARMENFELAYRMQMEATDAFDISLESESTRLAYGDNPYGKQALIARRLLERGVRFIQLWTEKGQPWDNHDDIMMHQKLARPADQAIAAFIYDIKQRGLFDETLMIWGGEFGRTPAVELPSAGVNLAKMRGRDHNHWGFSMWLAGGGVKGGQVIGSTDEFGFAATEDPYHVHDLHATILELMGFDHTALTYKYAGLDFKLTGVNPAKVIKSTFT